MEFAVQITFRQKWNDPRLRWESVSTVSLVNQGGTSQVPQFTWFTRGAENLTRGKQTVKLCKYHFPAPPFDSWNNIRIYHCGAVFRGFISGDQNGPWVYPPASFLINFPNYDQDQAEYNIWNIWHGTSSWAISNLMNCFGPAKRKQHQ